MKLKIIKRLITFLLVLILSTICLTGCSTSNDNDVKRYKVSLNLDNITDYVILKWAEGKLSIEPSVAYLSYSFNDVYFTISYEHEEKYTRRFKLTKAGYGCGSAGILAGLDHYYFEVEGTLEYLF